MVSFKTLAFVLLVALVAADARKGEGEGEGRGGGRRGGEGGRKRMGNCEGYLRKAVNATDAIKKRLDALKDKLDGGEVECEDMKFPVLKRLFEKIASKDCPDDIPKGEIECDGDGDGEVDGGSEASDAVRDNEKEVDAGKEEMCQGCKACLEEKRQMLACGLKKLKCRVVKMQEEIEEAAPAAEEEDEEEDDEEEGNEKEEEGNGEGNEGEEIEGEREMGETKCRELMKSSNKGFRSGLRTLKMVSRRLMGNKRRGGRRGAGRKPEKEGEEGKKRRKGNKNKKKQGGRKGKGKKGGKRRGKHGRKPEGEEEDEEILE